MSISLCQWRCRECDRINMSDPFEHHKMDICKCGKTGLDLETYGARIMGNIKIMRRISRHFEKERLIPYWTTFGKNNEFPEGKKISVSEMDKYHMESILETQNISQRIKWLIKRELRR